MIINKTSVSFAGRVPSPRYIPVGVVGDNRVECVEFRLPTIADSQTATMLINCKFADAITLELTENNLYCADITSQIAGESGNIEAYIRIDGTDGAVWNSEKIILCVCNVPDISGKVEEQEPTALERTLSAIAAHNADMEQHSETMEQISKTASESAVAAERYATAAEKSAQAAAKHEAVSYKPQELTESQQAQARQNIAAASKAEVDKLSEEKADKSEIPAPYALPVATADTLGGVRIGGGFEPTNDGTLNPLYRGMELIRSFVVSADSDEVIVDRDTDNQPFELTCAALHVVCGGNVATGKVSNASVCFATAPGNHFARTYYLTWEFPGYKINDDNIRKSSLKAVCDVRDGICRLSGSCGDEGAATGYSMYIADGQFKYAPNEYIVEIRASFFIPKNAEIYLYGTRRVKADG